MYLDGTWRSTSSILSTKRPRVESEYANQLGQYASSGSSLGIFEHPPKRIRRDPSTINKINNACYDTVYAFREDQRPQATIGELIRLLEDESPGRHTNYARRLDVLQRWSSALSSYLPTAVLPLFAYRNVDWHELWRSVQPVTNDWLFPIATAILGGWLVYTHQKQPSPLCTMIPEVSTNQVMFHDVFGQQRLISLTLFQDAEILHAFFRSHYRGTDFMACINNKQYNLAISHRYGAVMELHVLCSDSVQERLTKEGNITMSVVCRASYPSCKCCHSRFSHAENTCALGQTWSVRKKSIAFSADI